MFGVPTVLWLGHPPLFLWGLGVPALGDAQWLQGPPGNLGLKSGEPEPVLAQAECGDVPEPSVRPGAGRTGCAFPPTDIKAEVVVKSEPEEEAAYGGYCPGSQVGDVPHHPAACEWGWRSWGAGRGWGGDATGVSGCFAGCWGCGDPERERWVPGWETSLAEGTRLVIPQCHGGGAACP